MNFKLQNICSGTEAAPRKKGTAASAWRESNWGGYFYNGSFILEVFSSIREQGNLGKLIFVVDVQSKLEVLEFLKCVVEIDILIQNFGFIYRLLSIFCCWILSFCARICFLLLVALMFLSVHLFQPLSLEKLVMMETIHPYCLRISLEMLCFTQRVNTLLFTSAREAMYLNVY